MSILKKAIILFNVFFILIVGCNPLKKNEFDFFKENSLVISNGQGNSFSFNSENKNLICLAFLNNFQDSIVVFCDKKRVLNFIRNDTINYMNMKHEEIFKTVDVSRKRSQSKIEIYLLKEKSKVSFDLVKGESLYLISRYNQKWYLTLWAQKNNPDYQRVLNKN
ncbi:MAG: hypothetical protein IM568_01890 [Flavobacterium sp.]|nr:hypothetical protein [Flavobacterium sp.]